MAHLPPARLRYLLTPIALLAGYMALDWVSYLFPYKNLNITPWNPLAGLSVFVLLRWGFRFAPLLLIGRIFGDTLIRTETDSALFILTGAATAIGGQMATACILRGSSSVLGENPRFREVVRFILLTTVAAALAAIAYVGLLAAVGALGSEFVLHAITRRFIGDLIGIVSLVPALAIIHDRVSEGQRPLFEISPENLLQVAALLAVEGLIFGVEAIDEYKFFYLLFMPMIWIAVRGGFVGAALGILAAQIGVLAVIQLAGTSTDIGVTSIQALMTALAVTGLLLGTVESERREAEAKLSKAQAEQERISRRWASGELASAIAHELNQPLTAIINYARVCQMLHEAKGPDEELQDTLEKTVQQTSRAGEIMRRLRDLVRRGESAFEPMEVADAVAEAVRVTTPLLRASGIALQTRLEADLPVAFADRLQVIQVLCNLVRNASEAMAETSVGNRVITISAALTGQAALVLRVTDSGPGLSPAIRERLFDPFVTSKQAGMGLGLAISRSIVIAHGGKLWHEANPRGGATFSFTLPIYQPEDPP